MQGAARCTYGPNESYVGQFSDGKKNGYGEYKFRDGHIYKGEWKDGDMTSKGVIVKE